MGCDIHFYTEKYTTEDQISGPGIDLQKIREENIDSILENNNKPKEKKWISVDEWSFVKDVWSNAGEEHDDSYWESSEYYHGRNYEVFSILANVRKYDDDKFGHDPKGVPEDASDSYLYMLESWKGDAHSPSYFTLTELIEMDWDRFEYVGNFKETIEKMKKIDDNYDNVRCCFFFDN